MNKLVFFLACFISGTIFHAQTIQCSFPQLSKQWVKLGVFNGLQSKNIDSALVGENGTFSFNVTTDNPGIGYLITEENKPYFLILDKGEKITLSGEYLAIPESVRVLSGQQNRAFSQYASEHPKREQTLSAWRFLDKIYTLDSLFSSDKKAKNFITSQSAKIKKQDLDFLAKLDPKSYVAWYLPMRRLVSEVSVIAQFRTEEIPSTIQAFRSIDYTDDRLYRSGLLRDAVESHFWLLENSGKSLDSVFVEMKRSIDSMMPKLVKDEKKLNEITNFLFDLLERQSLFQASEYLALKVLNELSCTIDQDLVKQLETYRAMKKGNIAPDFSFPETTLFPPTIQREHTYNLSDLNSPYFMVVFGSSTCPKCTEEIPQIAQLYAKWKSYGVEVIFVSLDESMQDFQEFTSSFPFVSTSDFKKWKSPIAESYYVFGTPTMFLLDNKREILLRPNSVNQMDAWVDWFLVQGNTSPR